jgi:trk system potassium uptake protein TrkA
LGSQKAFEHKNIPLCDLSVKKGVLICVIMRENKIIFPKGQDTLCEGDTLIAVSALGELKSINDIIG